MVEASFHLNFVMDMKRMNGDLSLKSLSSCSLLYEEQVSTET